MRLNSKTYAYLTQELRQMANEKGLQVQLEIVLKRLKKLSETEGVPLNQAEITEQITDLFLDFDEAKLAKAARLNQAKNWGPWLTLGGVLGAGVVGFVGLIWLVNLPYPMIRRPVAKVAPMLLLPSYLSMDRNYREAIAHVEQADQLVNNATSAADIEFGAKKVALAQRNLDQLPVWFLGYEPSRVCRFMGGCSWRFTFDEFQRARAQVGRMDARIFQEKNALTALQSAETTIQSAKNRYEQAGDAEAKQVAIADWRRAVNELSLIPPQTLAGGQARNKLKIVQQDFQQVAGWTAGSTQTQIMIAAAQQFASRADQVIATAPLTPDQWRETQTLYGEAINRLQQVKSQDPQYLKAQTFLADYTQKSAQINTRLAAEESAVQVFDGAQGQIKTLLTNMPDSGDTAGRNRLRGEITQIISQLQKVDKGTTVYGEAQTLIRQAQETMHKL